jgi:predicted ribosomally synthesized peptide with nif11-like leader
MSTESFKSFMARVSTDPALRDSLRAAAPDGMSAEQLAQAGATHGFKFAASDVTDELSEADLEGVAAGAIDTHIKHEGIKFGALGGLNQNAFKFFKWTPSGSTGGFLFKFF